jgi:flagellin
MSTINTNMQSLNAQRNLNASTGALSTSMQRLSSGLRVNSAKDDAAGLAIAERMNAQVKGMNVAVRNTNDAISLTQTAEGALGKIGDSLQRMRELAVQSATGTNTTENRTNLQAEFAELQAEVSRIKGNTKFNNTDAFAATTIQVGANSGETVDIEAADFADIDAAAVGTVVISGADATGANAALTALDTAIEAVTTERGKYGSKQNRFESVVANLQVASENQAAARGRIMDANFAVETSNLSRGQILQQAGTAMIAQANQLPQGVMSLLR